jgi:hypothetical protein
MVKESVRIQRIGLPFDVYRILRAYSIWKSRSRIIRPDVINFGEKEVAAMEVVKLEIFSDYV